MPRKKKETLVHLDLETMSQDMSVKKTRKTEEVIDNTLGGILRHAREKKKLSLAQVSRKLCIKEMYLEALENGHYYMFPGLAYGVGFLRTYALFLDLDATAMVEKFHAETSSIKVEPMEMPMPKSANLMPSFRTILMGLSLLIVVYLIWYIVISLIYSDEVAEISTEIEYSDVTQEENKKVEDETQYDSLNTPISADMKDENAKVVEGKVTDRGSENKASETTLPVVEAPLVADAVSKKTPKVEMKKAGFGSKLWSKLTPAKVYGDKKAGALSFVATEEVWVKISNGSETILEEILYKGDRYNVPAGTNYTLATANAGALITYINNKKTKPIGAKGVIAENIVLNPENFN